MNIREKNSKSNGAVHIIEIFVLISAAVFLSVVASVLFIDFIGTLCAVLASALFACVLFLLSPAIVALGAVMLSSAASFFITYLLYGNLINSLASIIYIAVGAFICFGVKAKWQRTRIAVGIICFLCLSYFGLIVFYFFLKTGSFSFAMVSKAVEITLSDSVKVIVGQIPTFSVMPELDKTAYIQEIVKNIKAVTPALFVGYNAIIAYLTTSFFKYTYNICIPMAKPNRKKIKNKYWRINISAVSAVTLAITLLAVVLVYSQKNLLPSIILTNLIYILAPGFCIVGIYFVHDKIFKEKTGIFFIVFVIATAMTIFILPTLLGALVFVLMILGLYATLIGDIKKIIEKAKKALLGDDDDDDDDYID